ncbi:E3 ubiquitin-protein ligase HERC [Acrasis kona]|uniref:E3 ubiquitin-protein ligase HERC n=1 Tax=Acrasis kona TaxID=1008807 RepID=A0AAW2ZMN3_9EUKA
MYSDHFSTKISHFIGRDINTRIFQIGTIQTQEPSRHKCILDDDILQGDKIIKITGGFTHLAMLTQTGKVYMMGENDCNKMGLPIDATEKSVLTPTLVPMNDTLGNPVFVSDIAAGYHHSMFLVKVNNGRKNFAVWGCGSNNHREISSMEGHNIEPTLLREFNDKNIVKIRCGYYSTILITDNGKVIVMGMNAPTEQELRHGLQNEFIVEAAAGYSYHMFITREGKVYAHGDNSTLQTGVTDGNRQLTLLQPLLDKRIISASASYNHTVFITGRSHLLKTHHYQIKDDYELFTTGDCGYGRLGREGYESKLGIGRVTSALATERVTTASAGGYHTIVSTEKGEVFGFGHSSFGQIGSNTLNAYGPNKINYKTFSDDEKMVYIIQAVATGWGSFLLEHSGKGKFLRSYSINQKLFAQCKMSNSYVDIEINTLS